MEGREAAGFLSNQKLHQLISLISPCSLLEEDDVEGNLPRVLLCSHIYCTSCLLSIQCDGVIKCPECDVEMTLPEGGVSALQEDSRIIGLIYTAKVNKIKSSRSLRCDRPKYRRGSKLTTATDMHTNAKDMEKPADIQKVERTIDEAMVQGSRNLSQLEHIHKTLINGLAEQVSRERAALEKEIKQTSDKALQAVQKWRDLQLNQLTKLEARFSTQETVSAVQERIKSLNIAMQMAREVRRVPFLEQYCTLDKVLETLQTPVDGQSFDMTCITLDSGLRCDFRLESLNQSLSMSLKMEVSKPKPLSESQPRGHQLVTFTRELPLQHAEDRNRNCSPPSRNKPPTPRKQNQEILKAVSAGHLPSPRPRRKSSFSRHSLATNLGTPDVIIEEVIDERQHRVHPPTGPELANEKWRILRRRKDQLSAKRDVTQWVVVTHIVNPSHFYVSYVAERRENETLSKKINAFCCKDSCHFTSRDTVETGSVIFVKWKEGLWCRARVVEVLQNGCADAVKTCPVDQLASIRVFLPDIGLTRSVTLQSEMGTTKSSLEALNSHLRKAGEAENVELSHFTPLAIRCSLKDLVPYDLTKGWSEEAQAEFQSVVGSAAVEMRPLGQDRDSLLVDLRKAPMDQSSDVPISVREYLVFIEVARFYSPVTPGRRPLLYYPPVYPKMNTEVNAVVSHINNPADFYIQLVDNMESLLLSAKLQECYNSAKLARGKDLTVYCPVIGHAYVARYDDKFWYRAQVIGHPGGRKVEVCYVDFGNKNILSVSDLRKIKDEFFALPTMAIHCCLSDVIPLDGETWSDACTQRFISLAHQKLVIIVATGTIRKADPLPVKLFESSLGGPKDDIAELLVKEQLACFKSGLKSKDVTPHAVESSVWDPPLEPILASKCGFAPDQKITRKQKEELLEFEPVLKLTDNLKDIKIRVSHVNSPSSFYVQLIQYDSLLKRVCELVKQECALMEPQDVVWKANMYCGAQINGVWERGRILCDVTSSDIAEVIRCDHGNIVKLHISNLRPLPSSLMGSLALECTLTDIRPAGGRTTWTATACDLFSYYLTGTPAVMNIKELTDERPLPVSLFCSDNTGQFVSIADFLASEGLALKERKPRDAVIEKPNETDAQSPPGETHASDDKKPTDGTPSHVNIPPLSYLVSTPAPPKPAPRTIMSAEKVKTSLYHPPELPCPGPIQMIVSAIGEDGLIFARTKNADCQLKQLQERIQQSMKTLPRQKMYTWKSVLGCAVIGPDMLWYRGQLLEVLGGHVKVQYVDYGLVENIPVVHVYPMLLCESVPQLCIPCKLHGVSPVGGRWHRDAVALLKEVLLNRCVDIQVMELPSDPRGPLTVEIFLDGMSLSRILCHHQHASVDQAVSAQKAYSVMSPAPSCLDDWDMSTEGLRGPEEPMLGRFPYPSLPQKGEQFRVRVKHLLTPNELFLWSLEETADVEVDGETLDEALYRINEDIDSLTHLTNYPQGGPCLAEYSDGRFYRARLIKFTSVEPIKILVQHVDFGSDDTLPPSKLRQMPAELLRFPSKALKVKVAGFKAPSVNRQDNVLPYSPEWSVKAAMDMIELLHNNITATVVAQEPELTVLLYNEDGDLVHLPLVIRGLAEIE